VKEKKKGAAKEAWAGDSIQSARVFGPHMGTGREGEREEYAMGFTRVLRAAHERDAALTLHHRRDGIAKELGLWSELADDGDLVRR
jgi:hypothetical protein